MHPAPLGVAHMCLLVIAVNTIREVTVWVVHSNMNAINVTRILQALSVIFVPREISTLARPSLALPTPVKINRLAPLLSGYSTTAEYLIKGFCFGFPIPFQGPSSSSPAPNLFSAQQHPDVVDHDVAKEVLASE